MPLHRQGNAVGSFVFMDCKYIRGYGVILYLIHWKGPVCFGASFLERSFAAYSSLTVWTAKDLSK